VGIPDCIHSAEMAVQTLLECLRVVLPHHQATVATRLE
jgi:hypothetical protein